MVLVGGCSLEFAVALPTVWPVLPTVGPAPASCAGLLLLLHGPACAVLMLKTMAAQQARTCCFRIMFLSLGFHQRSDVFGAVLRFTRNGLVHRMFHLNAHENGLS
jgi:hypothetical protein